MTRTTDDTQKALKRAREFATRGEDDAAKQAYLDVLRLEPTNFSALNEIGALAHASGHQSAARTAYNQAVLLHPDKAIARINLGNLLCEDGDFPGARTQYEAALVIDPDLPEAHQGLARVLAESCEETSDVHWRKGFTGHAIVTKRYRGPGLGVPLLLLVSARGGNIPIRHWIDDRHFAVTAIYTEFFDFASPLPPHALVVNAIGDADRCEEALTRAEALLSKSHAPLINPPALVRMTDRVGNAKRLSAIPGLIVPATIALPKAAIHPRDDLRFPLLLRSPGFHTGQHFQRVESPDLLPEAIGALPGDPLLAIEYLDAREPDGMTRKYRAMFIDGTLYPMHLAISADWKVHYFTAGMAANPIWREEEQCFLNDMPAVLGPSAMTALTTVGTVLGLDYAGIDFAVSPDSSVLLFEANATMVVNPPDPDPIWDYRRRAVGDVLSAARRLLSRHH